MGSEALFELIGECRLIVPEAEHIGFVFEDDGEFVPRITEHGSINFGSRTHGSEALLLIMHRTFTFHVLHSTIARYHHDESIAMLLSLLEVERMTSMEQIERAEAHHRCHARVNAHSYLNVSAHAMR